jgi:hypothetical protein
MWVRSQQEQRMGIVTSEDLTWKAGMNEVVTMREGFNKYDSKLQLLTTWTKLFNRSMELGMELGTIST